MIQLLREEEFTEEDWNDVFHVLCATFKWISENVKTDTQLISEGKPPTSSLESSRQKKRQQKD